LPPPCNARAITAPPLSSWPNWPPKSTKSWAVWRRRIAPP
jgi:hypothetical protein